MTLDDKTEILLGVKSILAASVLTRRDLTRGLFAFEGYLLAAAGATLFAAKAIVVKIAYAVSPGLSPLVLLALRMAMSLPIYITIGLWLLHTRKIQGKSQPRLLNVVQALVVGSIGYYLASYLDFVGLKYITAQLERLVLFTYPLIVLLISWLFLGHQLTLFSFLAFTLSYGGLVLVFFTGKTAQTPDMPLGVALVGGAALAFAMYQLASKRVMRDMGSGLYTCLAMGGAGVSVLTHSWFSYISSAEDWSVLLDPSLLGVGGLLAIVCTVLPSFMMSAAIARVGPEAVAVVGTLSPICTVGLAVMILGEPFGLTDGLGTLLVIFGVGLYGWLDRRSTAVDHGHNGTLDRGVDSPEETPVD